MLRLGERPEEPPEGRGEGATSVVLVLTEPAEWGPWSLHPVIRIDSELSPQQRKVPWALVWEHMAFLPSHICHRLCSSGR